VARDVPYTAAKEDEAMALDGAILGVALALPIWLVVEELVHRASRRVLESPTVVPAPRGRPVVATRAA
jgi:hypothetical protein